jgi:vacuolar-type H+-ATPase subunit E/Vma4
LADYLADKKPILALDWVVKREMGGREALVYKQLLENKPVILIETSWLTDIETEPEYELVREVIAQYNKMEQTAYFTVYKMNDE